MIDNDEIKATEYSDASVSERKSITILESLLDPARIVTYLSKNDKTPNYDGYLEVRGIDKRPVGKLETQVKTLRKNYKNPSHSVKLKLLAYTKDVVQLPFILIAVDQINHKAFWKEITPEDAKLFITTSKDKNAKSKSYSIQFDKGNEISQKPPYDMWQKIIKDHKEKYRRSDEMNKQLIISKTELKKLKSRLDYFEQDENSNYEQIHLFLDKLNDLFSNDFKVVRKLFVFDFWKLGIAIFGKLAENKITYSLFPIGWKENLKQIDIYQKSNDFDKFIIDYPSIKAYSGSNPILIKPENYAYEKLWEFLKLLLDKELLWPDSKYLQQEFFFHLKDTKFRSQSGEDPKVLDLVPYKKSIDNYLNLIPDSEKKRMKEFPEMKDNLYRALEYIQNFRIQGKESINRLSPSKKSLQNIATLVSEKGKFPEDIESVLFDYWNTLLNSYEKVLEDFFPLVKKELSSNHFTYIIVPYIHHSSFNNQHFNNAYLSVFKIKNEKMKRKIFIELDQSKVKFDLESTSIIYKGKKFKCSNIQNDRMIISSLVDDMPIRKGVYRLLENNLKAYFERYK